MRPDSSTAVRHRSNKTIDREPGVARVGASERGGRAPAEGGPGRGRPRQREAPARSARRSVAESRSSGAGDSRWFGLMDGARVDRRPRGPVRFERRSQEGHRSPLPSAFGQNGGVLVSYPINEWRVLRVLKAILLIETTGCQSSPFSARRDPAREPHRQPLPRQPTRHRWPIERSWTPGWSSKRWQLMK